MSIPDEKAKARERKGERTDLEQGGNNATKSGDSGEAREKAAESEEHRHPPPTVETSGRGPTVEVVWADGPPIDLDAWVELYVQLLMEELMEEEMRIAEEAGE